MRPWKLYIRNREEWDRWLTTVAFCTLEGRSRGPVPLHGHSWNPPCFPCIVMWDGNWFWFDTRKDRLLEELLKESEGRASG